MKPISSFFSKKGVSSDESKPQSASKYVEPIQPTLQATVKEEMATHGNMECQTFSDRNNKDFTDESVEDSKSNVSMPSGEGATYSQPKRDYEEFSAQEKSFSDITDKPQSTPARKKGNLGRAGDKQPTLFSYFGKG